MKTMGPDGIVSQRARLRDLVPVALDTLEGLLSSDDEGIRLQAAAYILKATGLDSVDHRLLDYITP